LRTGTAAAQTAEKTGETTGETVETTAETVADPTRLNRPRECSAPRFGAMKASGYGDRTEANRSPGPT
jgi:hypothetical protein